MKKLHTLIEQSDPTESKTCSIDLENKMNIKTLENTW